jgi:hypothetical protein
MMLLVSCYGFLVSTVFLIFYAFYVLEEDGGKWHSSFFILYAAMGEDPRMTVSGQQFVWFSGLFLFPKTQLQHLFVVQLTL